MLALPIVVGVPDNQAPEDRFYVFSLDLDDQWLDAGQQGARSGPLIILFLPTSSAEVLILDNRKLVKVMDMRNANLQCAWSKSCVKYIVVPTSKVEASWKENNRVFTVDNNMEEKIIDTLSTIYCERMDAEYGELHFVLYAYDDCAQAFLLAHVYRLERSAHTLVGFTCKAGICASPIITTQYSSYTNGGRGELVLGNRMLPRCSTI